MSAFIYKGKLIDKAILDDSYYTIKIKLEEINNFPQIKPGQFAQISLIYNINNSILPRPFSIMDYNSEEYTLTFLIKKVGKFTGFLLNAHPGEMFKILFPLGNGFSLTNNSLLIGGGSGIASIYALTKFLCSKGYNFDVLIGSKDNVLVNFFRINFPSIKLFCSTEDGSAGEKGLVTEHYLLSRIIEYKKVYVCGPELMMKKIAELCKKQNILCEVSLENTMACGFGVCLCCVTNTINGNVCTCTNGPIFNAKELLW